ncbi:hypothetical protein BGZ63DRAFT_339728, partial [Mariannaea sp. PMI_226]
RMKRPDFDALIAWLHQNNLMKSTKYQSVQQKVMIFLYVINQGSSQQNTAYCFGISQSTVSSVVHFTAEAFRHIFFAFIKQPDNAFFAEETLKPGLCSFQGCIGAVDSTHINAFIPSEQQKN